MSDDKMPTELKQGLLALIDRMRAAVEAEDSKAMQGCLIECLVLGIRTLSEGTDLLPLVIMEAK